MNEIAPVSPANEAMLSFIERAARDPDFDVAKFGILLDRQERLLKQQQEMVANQAMALVQKEMGQIIAKGKNPVFTQPYAKLEDLDNEARPIYTQHGFNIRYGTILSDNTGVPAPSAGEQRIVLKLSHAGGYSEEIHLDGPKSGRGDRGPARTPIQDVGATVTYLRRYLLQMVFNLVPKNAPEDRDGEHQRGPRQQQPAAPTHPLDEPNGTRWLGNLKRSLTEIAKTAEDVEAFRNDPSVLKRLDDPATPAAFKALIEDAFHDALIRVNTAAQ